MRSDSLRDTIEPKSDQLNADDLISGPMTVTVRDVVRGKSPEQPVQVVLDGHRPFRPCKSMRRVLIAAWGDQGKDWAGKSMTLFCDPSVKFGGVAVGGIRISHLSHIDKAFSMLLTATRSRRVSFQVQKMEVAVSPAEATESHPAAPETYVITYPGDRKHSCLTLEEYADTLRKSASKAGVHLEEFKRLNEAYVLGRIAGEDEPLASLLIDALSG